MASSRVESPNNELPFGSLDSLRSIPAALSAMVTAEAVLVFASIPLGLVMHGILFTGLLIAGTADRTAANPRCLAALSLVPLLRLLSFVIFGPTLPLAFWGMLASLAFIVATILMARALAIPATELGWRWPPNTEAVLVATTAAAAASAVASSAPAAFAPTTGGFTIPLFLVLSALGEELAFRGVLQSTLRVAYGTQTAVLLPQVPFAALYLGMYSGTFIVAVVILGLTLAWATEQSRSIVPAIVGHVTFNVALAFVWPTLP